ncbi:hypothetical protein K2Z83_21285 [Oscillochloris sp. ZM17-4]|nr:hypothetical protein [Oscillochloris sp. ZM17-4]MBX0330207.1 hypothetical protein [Oscillochloris sp. ZM17-4]
MLMTAPNMRTSKNSSHIHVRPSLTGTLFCPGARAKDAVARIGQVRLVLHVDLVALLAAARQIDVVAHLALDRHIRHQTLHSLGVNAGQIARVRVAVGVAVRHLKEHDEVVAAGDVVDDRGGHRVGTPDNTDDYWLRGGVLLALGGGLALGAVVRTLMIKAQGEEPLLL